MSDLIVIAFDDPHRAEEVRVELLRLQRDYLVDLEDAAVVVRKGDGKVRLHQIHHLGASGAVSGGFWGLLIGAIFMSPLLGAAVGAAAGGLAGSLADIGVDDQFMRRLGRSLRPGTSALFVLVRKATKDELLEHLSAFDGAVLQTSLSKTEEEELRLALEPSAKAPAS